MATRSSSACVAFNNMRFMKIFFLALIASSKAWRGRKKNGGAINQLSRTVGATVRVKLNRAGGSARYATYRRYTPQRSECACGKSRMLIVDGWISKLALARCPGRNRKLSFPSQPGFGVQKPGCQLVLSSRRRLVLRSVPQALSLRPRRARVNRLVSLLVFWQMPR